MGLYATLCAAVKGTLSGYPGDILQLYVARHFEPHIADLVRLGVLSKRADGNYDIDTKVAQIFMSSGFETVEEFHEVQSEGAMQRVITDELEALLFIRDTLSGAGSTASIPDTTIVQVDVKLFKSFQGASWFIQRGTKANRVMLDGHIRRLESQKKRAGYKTQARSELEGVPTPTIDTTSSGSESTSGRSGMTPHIDDLRRAAQKFDRVAAKNGKIRKEFYEDEDPAILAELQRLGMFSGPGKGTAVKRPVIHEFLRETQDDGTEVDAKPTEAPAPAAKSGKLITDLQQAAVHLMANTSANGKVKKEFWEQVDPVTLAKLEELELYSKRGGPKKAAMCAHFGIEAPAPATPKKKSAKKSDPQPTPPEPGLVLASSGDGLLSRVAPLTTYQLMLADGCISHNGRCHHLVGEGVLRWLDDSASADHVADIMIVNEPYKGEVRIPLSAAEMAYLHDEVSAISFNQQFLYQAVDVAWVTIAPELVEDE